MMDNALKWVVVVLMPMFAACADKPETAPPEVEQKDAVSKTDTTVPADTGPNASSDVPLAKDTSSEWSECTKGNAPGCPCETNTDCDSGYCLETGNGKVCTNLCSENCPDGWECVKVANSAADVTFICVPRFTNLCRPCQSGEDCTQVGETGGYCLPFENGAGSFCTAGCSDNLPCPTGYECSKIESIEGDNKMQCVPSAGACDCNEKASKEGAQTACSNTNDFGTCEGIRSCSLEGAVACDAAMPAKEICDGIDNNCDGTVDEEFPDTDSDGTLDCLDDDDDDDGDPDTNDCAPLDATISHQTTEVCDGIDNNCDGLADEDLGSTTCGIGECTTTTLNCSQGKPQECNPKFQPFELAELCDGKDNNCDGNVDEGQGEITCGKGNCKQTIPGCVDGQIQFCNPWGEMAPEACDGFDNNCNGQVDEGLGSTPCGKGECTHTVPNCADGNVQECDPLAGSVAEICDGKDNSCNGKVDDELGSTPCGEGQCAHTVVNCVAGKVQTCNPLEGAAAEICDGLDNDCDGKADEELGTSTCGQGQCNHTVQNCVDGSPSFCDPFAGSSTETCDGNDNDCDGGVDEDLGSTTCGQGECGHTVDNCVDGKVQTCNSLEGSAPETCDGKDNNCDGTVDEGLGKITCGKGICSHSVTSCVGGQLQQCDPLEGSDPESCDGLDNDCDGDVDEGLGETQCGKGSCSKTVQNCVNGKAQFCDPFDKATQETCDGKDNNCNGEVDEGLGNTQCGQGNCAKTIQNCANGKAQFCDPFDGATEETCDGKDNDCNGQTDEDLGVTTCGLGECKHTVQNCQNGETEECDPLDGEADEVCDGKDNDCNGLADDDLGSTTCGKGNCKHTVANCVDGKAQFCDPFAGSKTETCDKKDNDCNGQTDEQLGSTTCGLGECNHTVANCKNGQEQTCDPNANSKVEVCDGKDNDCDGFIDEKLNKTVTCGKGLCKHSIETCKNATPLACDPFEGKSKEVCDGQDNDCDGTAKDEIGIKVGVCKTCGTNGKVVMPTDDNACGVVDCKANFYKITGANDGTSASNGFCYNYTRPPLAGGSCKALGQCNTLSDCEAYNVTQQAVAGLCQKISGCSGTTPGSVVEATNGTSCGPGYKNCWAGKCAIFNYTVSCGKTMTGNKICHNAGFSGASETHGYWHQQCAGPKPLSCSPVSSTCVIDNNCDCAGCGGGWNTGGANTWKAGDGNTVYSQYACPGYNKGWLVRVKCF